MGILGIGEVTNARNQEEVIAFLSNPSAYDDQPERVERYETHGAIVFLAGEKAYKLKRAVRFPYMDYSTVERRRRMCMRELEVNRRFAPEIYEEVLPVIRDDRGQLRIGGNSTDSEPLDWLVVMRQFGQDGLLENMRRNGQLTEDILRQTGVNVARFHARAETNRAFGGYEGLLAVIGENHAALNQLSNRQLPQNKIDLLHKLSGYRLETVRGLLERRREHGYVRRVHGDLHLNNICVIGGKPVPFDAIEFRDDFAWIDTFYDLSFLLMDLDRHGLGRGANALLNAYLEQSRDYTGLGALPLFLSCRASIRVHVTMSMAHAKAIGLKAAEKDAVALLDRALAYFQPPRRRLIAVGGVSGTGKSTLARALAPAIGAVPGAVVLRSDVIRKELWGVAPMVMLSETAYAPEFSARVFKIIAERAEIILRAGHSVITDAVFGKPDERTVIATVAKRTRTPFMGLWLDAPADVLERRITQRNNDASDATIAVLGRQLRTIDPPDNWATIEATAGPEEVLVQAFRQLQSDDAP